MEDEALLVELTIKLQMLFAKYLPCRVFGFCFQEVTNLNCFEKEGG